MLILFVFFRKGGKKKGVKKGTVCYIISYLDKCLFAVNNRVNFPCVYFLSIHRCVKSIYLFFFKV